MRSMKRKRLGGAAALSLAGIFVAFMLEGLVLESWPWWGHGLAALASVAIGAGAYWWPEKEKRLRKARAAQREALDGVLTRIHRRGRRIIRGARLGKGRDPAAALSFDDLHPDRRWGETAWIAPDGRTWIAPSELANGLARFSSVVTLERHMRAKAVNSEDGEAIRVDRWSIARGLVARFIDEHPEHTMSNPGAHPPEPLVDADKVEQWVDVYVLQAIEGGD